MWLVDESWKLIRHVKINWGNKRFSNTIFIPHAICNTISCCTMENAFQILKKIYTTILKRYSMETPFLEYFCPLFMGPCVVCWGAKTIEKRGIFNQYFGLLYSNCRLDFNIPSTNVLVWFLLYRQRVILSY